MASGKKYYAVARGRTTGIFTAWSGPDGAEAQVRGYPGARYKGFGAIEDARQWLAEETGTPVVGQRKRRVQKQADKPSSARQTPAGVIEIYTDGGCINNPGPGGYGVVILDAGRRKELSGGFRRTTNNRMELFACIQGLRAVPESSPVVLYSDSQYLVNAMNRGWAQTWRRNGWKRAGAAPVENCDLWEQLLALCDRRCVEFVWLKGHAGTAENERCDRLARYAATRHPLPPDNAYEDGSTRVPVQARRDLPTP